MGRTVGWEGQIDRKDRWTGWTDGWEGQVDGKDR